MEIFLNGPGGTVSTWELTEAAYNYWKDNTSENFIDLYEKMENFTLKDRPPRNPNLMDLFR